jgi:hypothetical protein
MKCFQLFYLIIMGAERERNAAGHDCMYRLKQLNEKNRNVVLNWLLK